MSYPRQYTDEKLAELLGRGLSTHEVAVQLGVKQSGVFLRAQRLGLLTSQLLRASDAPQRAFLKIKNGAVMVGSDMHYWPGVRSAAHRGFVTLAKRLKPAAVIANGDVIDGSTISRHPPIGWEGRPAVIDELTVAQDRLDEIRMVTPKAYHVWNLGNHDARFETRLAMVAPEYKHVKGVHLRDHFPEWEPAWSTWINDDVVVKHRFKGGTHAGHNNTLWAGKTMVTGHLHQLSVVPVTDYHGTRWGVQTGTMAQAFGPQFVDYTEDNPVNWVSGFVVLEFKDGQLLWPDVAYVLDQDHIAFRGQVIKV